MAEFPTFPNEADVIWKQAQAFRKLSGTERMLAIIDLIASGMTFLENSPHREAGLRLRSEHEEEWKRIHRELFQRHAG